MFEKWVNRPDSFLQEENKIIIEAESNTDFFVNPASKNVTSNAHLYMVSAGSEFTFSCRVKPFFESTYDAGAVMVYIDKYNWVKFAFEQTDIGYPAVVSVLTREYSDDCNGEEISFNSIYLKISKKEELTGLYYSLDGENWKMKRLFRFDNKKQEDIYFGIEAQSPQGNGCKVEFSEMIVESKAVNDFRKGI